jgi:hypothetical protein
VEVEAFLKKQLRSEESCVIRNAALCLKVPCSKLISIAGLGRLKSFVVFLSC